MDDSDIIYWYFDQYVNVIRMFAERPPLYLIHEGIDEETLQGLYCGILGFGFQIKWRLSFFVAPDERDGKKAVLAHIFLFRNGESKTAPERAHEVKLFFMPDTYERLRREALQKEHRRKEGELIPPEENEEFIRSLGITTPES